MGRDTFAVYDFYVEPDFEGRDVAVFVNREGNRAVTIPVALLLQLMEQLAAERNRAVT